MIGHQEADFTVSQAGFGAELAAARTFAPAEELQQSIEAGRGHGEPCEEVVQLVVEPFAGRCLEMHFGLVQRA